MDLWFVIAAPIVVGAFLAWYLWSSARRRRRGGSHEVSDDPRDTWDSLSAGDDPTDR